MANTASAIKKIRVDKRRYRINLRRKRAYKEARKEVVKAVEAGDKKLAEEKLTSAFKEIDKAAKTNIIHKNAASRYKSKLSVLVSKM